ncbi:hypothetical protein LA080_010400 [Diaporthe eres]|nr:hypothetical protein LA080_010400 [Diaporthe eres]
MFTTLDRHVRVDIHVHVHHDMTHRWLGQLGSAMTPLIDEVSLTGRLPRPSTRAHARYADTKPRAKGLARLGKAFSDVLMRWGRLWAAGHQHGAMPPSPPSAEGNRRSRRWIWLPHGQHGW